MLDENLPSFFIKPSDDDRKNTIYLSHRGSELKPEYTLQKPDPTTPGAKNCYAIALYDSYNPEVLYAEVIVHPEWTQPTLSQAELRNQSSGGITAPPVPIVPSSFAIQLYNPDQQVVVKKIEGTWNTSAYWEFEMPQHTFRLPSASALDRSLNDPAAEATTPKITFKWKRDGKLSKDMTCVLAGKSTDGRKSTKEPDITVCMFKGGKEVTVYEPNMHRVEVEDNKGLEVVLILSARVIRDVFFNASREMFNIGSPTTTPTATKRKNSGPIIGGKTSTTPPAAAPLPPPPGPVVAPQTRPKASSISKPSASSSRPPPADPRTQWEIDAETARLKAIVEQEQRERDRADELEQERIKKMLEEEEKERRRRDAEVERETERLRRQFGVTAIDDSAGRHVRFSSVPPPQPPRPSGSSVPTLSQNQTAPHSRPVPVQRPQSTPMNAQPSSSTGPFNCPTINTWWHGPGAPPTAGPSQPPASSSKPSKTKPHKSSKSSGSSPYMQVPGAANLASLSGFFGGGQREREERSGIFGLGGSDSRNRVSKKRSVNF